MTVPAAQAAVFTSDTPSAGWSVNGRVYATAIVGDTVFVGGNFTSATSPSGAVAARKNLAAFSMSSGELLSGWRADAGGQVRALEADDTTLYVGGAFGRVGGKVATRIAKVDVTSAAVDQSFGASADNTVRALELAGGSLYAGGAFLTAGGQPRTRLAKFDATTGSLSPSFNGSTDNTVYGLAKNPVTDNLYVSGVFRAVGGASRNGVGAVNATTGQVTPVVFASAARPTLGLDMNPDGTRLFGAGGSGSNAAAAWNTTTGARVWRHVTDGDIQAIAYHSGTVYFGFHDGYQADTTVKMLAADATTGLLQPFRPRFNMFWGVFAISVSDSGIVAGGEWTRVSGVAAQGLVRFLATGGPPPAPPVTTRYLGSTNAWSYWDQGTRPNGWETSAFDASAWPAGRPQLGYGDGDETTVIDSGPSTSRYVTAYFRAHFNVSAMPTTLDLQLLADDGAVVYVNGVEAARDNMPTGPVTNSTRASTGRSGGAENALRPFSLDPSLLVPGDNVIAVEVHQVSPTSSDLGMDVDLTGTFPSGG